MLDATVQPSHTQIPVWSNINWHSFLNKINGSIFTKLHTLALCSPEGTLSKQVKLLECCKAGHAAQTRSFPIQTHNHGKE